MSKLKVRPLGKGMEALLGDIKKNSDMKIEKPGFIEIPYPKEDHLGFIDILACIGLACGFISLGMFLH